MPSDHEKMSSMYNSCPACGDTGETGIIFKSRCDKGKGKYEDYTLEELKTKASQWHKLTLGSLVMSGCIQVAVKGA